MWFFFLTHFVFQQSCFAPKKVCKYHFLILHFFHLFYQHKNIFKMRVKLISILDSLMLFFCKLSNSNFLKCSFCLEAIIYHYWEKHMLREGCGAIWQQEESVVCVYVQRHTSNHIFLSTFEFITNKYNFGLNFGWLMSDGCFTSCCLESLLVNGHCF